MGLRPNRSLLNPKFEGYRLGASGSQSIIEQPLQASPQCVQLSEKYFSLQLVRAFSTWNHLVLDPANSDSVYFVDRDFNIVLCCVTDNSVNLSTVLTLSRPAADCTSQPYNPSIVFCGAEHVVVSDGRGRLHLARVTRRSDGCSSTWSVSHTYCHDQPFLLLDSVECGDQQLQCAVLVFDEGSATASADKGHCVFTVQWLRLQDADDGQLTLADSTDLTSQTVPYYTALCRHGDGLCMLTEGRFVSARVAQSDSNSQQQAEVPVQPITTAIATTSKPALDWQQDSDFVTVTFQLESDVRARDIAFSLSSDDVSLGLKDGLSLLRGELCATVDPEGSAWTIEKHVLELSLAKHQPGRQWTSVLKQDDDTGDLNPFPLRSVDNLSAEERAKILRQMEHLTSDKPVTEEELCRQRSLLHQELEDCDVAADKEHCLVRYGSDGRLAEQVNVTANQWLFNTRLSSCHMPCVCLRSDVDACVWQPSPPTSGPAANNAAAAAPGKQALQCQHVATFNALGYVSASKQQKKFMACPSDASYSVICECTRNVFLYFPEESTAATPPSNNALQAIFSLPSPDDAIMGVAAMTSLRVLVLAESNVYLLKV